MKFTKFKFIELDTRSKLAEGKNFGVGFCYCRREGSQLVALQAISPCRDFLNDEIFSHHSRKPFSIYGQESTYSDMLHDGNSYLAFGVCKRGRNLEEYNNYKLDYKSLEENYKSLEKFINYFETKFKVKQKSKIIRLQDNRYVCISSLFWTDATYKASLLSFLLRAGIYYKSGNPLEYLDNFNQDHSDKMLYNSFKSKLLMMLDGVFPAQDLINLKNIHNCGIVSFDGFPKATTLYNKTEAPPAKPANNLQPINF